MHSRSFKGGPLRQRNIHTSHQSAMRLPVGQNPASQLVHNTPR